MCATIWFEYVCVAFSSWWLTAVAIRIIFMIFGSTPSNVKLAIVNIQLNLKKKETNVE